MIYSEDRVDLESKTCSLAPSDTIYQLLRTANTRSYADRIDRSIKAWHMMALLTLSITMADKNAKQPRDVMRQASSV